MDICGDEIKDIIAALKSIEFSIHQGSRDVTTGGYSWGGNWKIKELPDQTHDGWVAAIDAWLEEKERSSRHARAVETNSTM